MASLSFKVVHDDISPALARMARTARFPSKVFRAMGTTFMSITMGNFHNADYRPRPWPAKKDGSASNLQKSGTLSRSFHLEVTDQYAKLGTPVPYAPTHQFGSKGHKLGQKTGDVKTKYANPKFAGSWNPVLEGGSGTPPRPYFPVENGRLTPAAEEKIKAAGEREMLRQIQNP